MARAKSVTYECEQCGSEIVVTSTGEGELSPIYCCGIEVVQVSSRPKKAPRSKKSVAKKVSSTRSTSKKGKPATTKKPTK